MGYQSYNSGNDAIWKMKEHNLMLSYKRTMSDIPYSAISSAVTWIDSYNYSIGNANLKAPSSDMLMAGLSMFRNKVTLIAIYAYVHNRIYWQTFSDEENPENLYTKPINLLGRLIGSGSRIYGSSD